MIGQNTSAILSEIQALQDLASQIGWTITNTMGRITGYLSCSLAEQYRTVGFSPSDPDWLEWRVRVYEDTHSWRAHLEVLQNKLRAYNGTLAANIIEAAGMAPKSLTKVPYSSNFEFGKDVLELAGGCFVTGLLPEPSYEQWEKKGKDASWIRIAFAKFCQPSSLFSYSIGRDSLYSELTRFSQQVIGDFDPIAACHCRPVSNGCELENLVKNLM